VVKHNNKVLVAVCVIALCFNTISANAADKKYKDALSALNTLKVADEVRTGYKREKFKHWVGVGNGCDSRKAVIISEATVKPTVDKKCAITGGKWLSIYDGVTVTEAGKLDVDHMVPLAEAWDSGAQAWDAKKREFYANDQIDPRHLIAVTGASNRSKSDRDPADWLPTNKAYVCEYLTNWVSVKVRWSLSVDKKEKDAIANNLKSCKKTSFSVTIIK
jgi:hypothetical protein